MKNNNMKTKTFEQALKEFCYEEILKFNKDEREEILDEVEEAFEQAGFGDRFDPLLEWDFEPVFSYEALGNHLLAPNFRHNKLFNQNAILLHILCGTFTGGSFQACNMFELWLLEDMSFAVTLNYELIMERKTEYEFTTKYRQIVDEIPSLSSDCLIEIIQYAANMAWESGYEKFSHIER